MLSAGTAEPYLKSSESTPDISFYCGIGQSPCTFQKSFHLALRLKEIRYRLVTSGQIPIIHISARIVKGTAVKPIIDNKAIERDLPLLNEFGAAKLTFFPAELSQNFRIDIERLERIARHSSEQCGRSDYVQIALAESLDSLLHSFPQAAVFDFGGESLAQCAGGVREILIGAEGGFSEKEREKMRHLRKLSSGELVLRASSAAVFAQANAWRIVG